MKLKELASFLGTTPETISRKLRLFNERQLLTQKQHTINLIDIEELEALKSA